MRLLPLAAPRFLRIAFLLFLACLASGCTLFLAAQDPARSPPKEGESPVVVSVTGNTAQVTSFNRLTVRRTDLPPGGKDRFYLFTQVAPGLSRDTALFVGVLPQGEYELAWFDNDATRQYLSLTQGSRRQLGPFKISGGKPVDLGRLIITPVDDKVAVGRSARLTSNLPMIRRFAPEQAKFFDGLNVLGWAQDHSVEDQVESHALSYPVGADNPLEADDGRVFAGSRLGTVLVRERDGRWAALRSGGLESIISVLPVRRADASLLAVGEFSTLLRQPPGEKKLVAIDPGDLPAGNLLFIDGDDRHGWYVLSQKGEAVTLYRSAQLEKGHWQALRSESISRDFWSRWTGIWLWRRPGGLSYAVSSGSIHSLEYASGQWTVAQVPNNERVFSIVSNPNGSLGALTFPSGNIFGGLPSGSYLSSDQGKTWREIKSGFKLKVAAPRQTMSGALLIPGDVSGSQELHASTDGGLTWQRRSEFRLNRTLTPLPSGGLLAVDWGLQGLFSISHSGDEGVTWRTEYTNFNKAVYDAMKK